VKQGSKIVIVVLFSICLSLIAVPVIAGHAPGSLVGWGYNSYGQATPPAGNDYIAIDAGESQSAALRSNGSIVGWGRSDLGISSPPPGNDFVAIATGGMHGLALRSNGSVVGWGNSGSGQASPPPGNDFVAIDAGFVHSLALRSDGSIVQWGNTENQQGTAPPGNDYVAIAAGFCHSLALRSNGSIIGWGRDDSGCANPPAGNDFVAIAAGSDHSLALRSNGSVVGWGNNYYGQATAPAGNDFVAIAAGSRYSLALRSNGSIAAWGENNVGQCNVPAGNEFAAIAGGYCHGLALMAPSITVTNPNGFNTWTQGSTHTIRWAYTGNPGPTVKIEALQGTTLLGVITPGIPIGSGGAGSYRLVLPFSTPPGTDYKIRVTSTEYPACTDTSNFPFTISPAITVVSPNGGEKWIRGSSQTIHWSYSGDPGTTVKIEALRGSELLAVITPFISIGSGGSGFYSLTVPLSSPLGTDYTIRVTSTRYPACTDTSDGPFRISEVPTITVASPNGGENWVQGSFRTINWSYTGDPGPAVKIEAFRGMTLLAVINPGTPIGSGGSGSYPLTLPFSTPPGTEYRIKVTSTSYPACTDTSDAPFTISPAISVVSPNGGENWIPGSSQTISWSYTGDPGPTVKIEALRGSKVLAVINSSTSIGSGSSGSYELTVPFGTPLGTDYRIRVTSTSYPACTDTSDAPFTVSTIS